MTNELVNPHDVLRKVFVEKYREVMELKKARFCGDEEMEKAMDDLEDAYEEYRMGVVLVTNVVELGTFKIVTDMFRFAVSTNSRRTPRS